MKFGMTMKRMLQLLLAGLVTGGFLTAAWGQASYSTPYTFVTIAGTAGNSGGNDGTNRIAQFHWPEGITVDTNGNLYVVDNYEMTVRKVAPVGTNWVVTTIAGTAGNNGSANGTNGVAQFNEPASITVDGLGQLYVADYGYNTIRKVTPVGTNWVVSTIAGTAGSGGPADGTNGSAQFNNPSGITVDTNGNLYVADFYNSTIRKGQIAAVLAVPALTIGFTALNSLVVSWPSLGSYTLQSNADLTTANWVNYGGAFTTSNGTNSVTISPPVGNLFFRLTP